MALNREAYTIKPDNLIYDAKHPIDAVTLQVAVAADKDGEISRGQVLYAKDGEYSLTKSDGGEAGAIAAETTSYASDDTEVTLAAYISGTFRRSHVMGDLTDADAETLRTKGIYLK
jgi:hypothetical protein